jgi:ketosteroid isomerase-like protein
MRAALPHPDARVRAVVDFFEHLTPADLERMGAIYLDDAWFKDPFNEVQGLAAIQRIFAHMFESTVAPRFEVLEAIGEGEACFLVWHFHFGQPRLSAQPLCIRGGSHLRFGADGRVVFHRDYWDAAEELYEKVPLLGALMRYLRRKGRV